VYALAEKLGKFAHEVLAMPAGELQGWLAYFDYLNKTRSHHG
jgi:hypothetical protein